MFFQGMELQQKIKLYFPFQFAFDVTQSQQNAWSICTWVAITGALGEDKSLSNERDAPKEHDQTSPKILYNTKRPFWESCFIAKSKHWL